MNLRKLYEEVLKELYYRDFTLWAEINWELLKVKFYDLVDWENLLKEVKGMARCELNACISQMAIILENMFKWDNFNDYTSGKPDKNAITWIKNIENARDRIDMFFKRSPVLKISLQQEFKNAWLEARVNIRAWLRERDLELSVPDNCPYHYKDAMFRDLRKELQS